MERTCGKLFLIRNWKKYIIVVLLIFVQCRFFQSNVQDFSSFMNISYDISVGDYIADFYKGTIPYAMLGNNEPFNIPAIWSIYFIYFFAVIGVSAIQISKKYECQMLIRCITRKRWWRCQSLVICMETIVYLLVTYVSFFLYGLLNGAKMSGMDASLQKEFNGIDLSGFSRRGFLINTVLISFFVMLALAFLQYIISLKGNVIIGIIVSVVILISSVFQMNPLLLCNYLMLVRREEMLLGGMDISIGILICILIVVTTILACRKVIEKKDLF